MPALPLLAQRVPPLPPVAETPYTLGAGDLLRIDIFDVPEYSGEYVVAVDGTLNLPTLGIVRVEGLTVLQAQEVLSGRYAPFLVRPIITVTLLTPRPVQVAISGEVNLPGSYTFTAAEGRQFPTITQAIETAGGITQAAEVQRVVIRRSLSGQPTITVDLAGTLAGGSSARTLPCGMETRSSFPPLVVLTQSDRASLPRSALRRRVAARCR
ncbi:MAG: polysaccharide export protein [Coleofasciculaceae cyanobacterium SM2_3_26]|nr:polysaccharide export protein [Coleofasciculaceae cyanobacterium SM2_3_26]